MSPTLDAFLRSWPFDPWLVVALLLSAAIYVRGWLILHRRDPRTLARLASSRAFLGGLAALFLALASPIEPFAALLLQVHMVQHLLLMMVAPPLLWLGCAAVPDAPGPARGRPHLLGRPAVALADAPPVLRAADAPGSRRCRSSSRATWLWHVPAVYETRLALERLALAPAPLFPRLGAPVLVSRRPAVSRAGRAGRPGSSSPT